MTRSINRQEFPNFQLIPVDIPENGKLSFSIPEIKVNEISTIFHVNEGFVSTSYPTFDQNIKIEIIDDREETFNKLVGDWHKERAGMSSPDDIFNCASYKKILNLGPIIQGYIINKMENKKNKPDFWFDALEKINFGFTPVDEKDAGDLTAINNAWLKWLKSNEV
jgi:hypothetical protein